VAREDNRRGYLKRVSSDDVNSEAAGLSRSKVGRILRAIIVLLLIAGGLVGVWDYQRRHPANGYADNPFSEAPLYVADPSSMVSQPVVVNYARQNPAADWAKKLAGQPQSYWVSSKRDTEGFAEWLAQVDQKGGLPQVVLYRIPNRDCGNFSAAGKDALDERRYNELISRIIEEAGKRKMVIYYEVDAISGKCFTSGRAEQIRKQSARLSKAGYAVYLDAGAPRTLSVDEISERLEEAGVRQTRGFFVNASSFFTDAESRQFGDEIVRRLKDDHGLEMHYVVDSSRNGQGRPSEEWRREHPNTWWCNPPGVGLGVVPGVVDDDYQDAFAWIKTPGRSDGTCDRQNPPAGTFWPEYAAGLVANAKPGL